MITLSLFATYPSSGYGQPGDGLDVKELAKLKGAWKIAPGFKGQISPFAPGPGGSEFTTFVVHAVAGKQIEFKDSRLIFPARDGKSVVELNVKLDAAATPMSITATTAKDEVVFRGIIKIEKDSLVLCVAREDRPKDFKHTPKTPVLELKRKATE
jgi:uncharacterized protein (TIGR03067 family)